MTSKDYLELLFKDKHVTTLRNHWKEKLTPNTNRYHVYAYVFSINHYKMSLSV